MAEEQNHSLHDSDATRPHPPLSHTHTGVDMSVLESVVDSMSFDPILNQPELARFVDQVRVQLCVG